MSRSPRPLSALCSVALLAVAPSQAHAAIFGLHVSRRCERFRHAARNVDDVVRLGQARHTITQLSNESLPVVYTRSNGMPPSTSLAQAARTAGVSSLGWLQWTAT